MLILGSKSANRAEPATGRAPAGYRARMRDALLPLLERCFRAGGILGYHGVVEDRVPSPEMHVSVGTLRAHLEYLRDRYRVISLRELVERRERRRSTDRCIAITFDDAYVGVERLAAPMLAELDLPSTVFVTIASAEMGGTYWWDYLERARAAASGGAWSKLLERFGMPFLPPDEAGLATIRAHLLVRHAGRAAVSDTAPATLPRDELRSMDFAALRRLARDERFDFGCHTLTHPALPFLAPAEQEHELRAAQRVLERELPRVRPIVAYPYGLYNDDTIAAARRAGMHAGVTMQARALGRGDAVLTLPRTAVSEHWTTGAISLRVNAGIRPVLIARAGGIHPRLPSDPLPV